MDVFLDGVPPRQVTASIYRQVREAIDNRRLRAGQRLPPTRALAVELGVSRHTITTVYGRLVAEGFLEGAAGGGTRVADTLPPTANARGRRASALRPRSTVSALAPRPVGPFGGIDLRAGLPDPGLFPQEDWRRAVGRALRRPALSQIGYREAAGEPGLRDAIAAWAATSRGVIAEPGNVVVTAGAQQAFGLILDCLVEPGDVVAVEDPGYPPFRDLARLGGARVVAVPVDDDGLVVDSLPDDARLVYVTPSHQFPTGAVLSLRRRRQLLAWARQRNAVLVEDDYDSEFRFDGRPLEPLQRLEADGRVLYVGTFSKTLSPALRLGFLIAPSRLVGPLTALRQLSDWHSEPATQLALARFLEDGTMARHLNRTRRVYAERHSAVVEYLGHHLPDHARLIPSAAGLHIAFELGSRAAESAIKATADASAVALNRLDAYSLAERTRPGFVIGYGAASLDDLRRGLELLLAGRTSGSRRDK